MTAGSCNPEPQDLFADRDIPEDQLGQHLYELRTLGFTIVPRMLTLSESNDLRHSVSRALERERIEFENNPHRVDGMVNNLAIHGDDFYKILDHGIMHQILSAVLGENCIVYAYSSTLNEANAKTGAHGIHVDASRFTGDYAAGLGMMLALDDFTLENGATWMLPGSFNMSDRPSAMTFENHSTRILMNDGDAAFFNPRTYHRAGLNTSTITRNAISVYAVRSFMKPRYDYTRCVPESDIAQLSERVKRFLGFNVRVPASREEFYVAPEDRLYKSGQG